GCASERLFLVRLFNQEREFRALAERIRTRLCQISTGSARTRKGHFRGGPCPGTTDRTQSPVERSQRMRRRTFLMSIVAYAAVLLLSAAAQGASPDLVVSQVFAGGGNAGASFTNDYVELFNRGN